MVETKAQVGWVTGEELLEASRGWTCMTPPVERRREACRSTIVICPEFMRWYTKFWKENEGDPFIVRRAKAVRGALENIPISIKDGELIVGSQTSYERGGCLNLWGGAEDAIEQLNNKVVQPEGLGVGSVSSLSEDVRQELLELAHYWRGRSMVCEERQALQAMGLLELCDDLQATRMLKVVDVVAGGQRSTDYGKLLAWGLEGVIARAQEGMRRVEWTSSNDLRRLEFYQATVILCQGVINWARRYAELARAMAREEENPFRKGELEEIARVCERVPAKPACSFWEALQSHWFIHLAMTLEDYHWGVNPGRVDQTWMPYYREDIEAGRINRDRAAELVALFCIKLNEIVVCKDVDTKAQAQGNLAQYMTLGGATREGKDACNELTFLILQVLGQLRLSQPVVAFRCHGGLMHQALIKALETNRAIGGGIPIFFGDGKKLRDLLAEGVSPEDAYEWIITGCNEASVQHSSAFSKQQPIMSAVKPLEWALYNGVDPLSGKRQGIKTGDPCSFASFEDMYEAYKRQFAYAAKWSLDIARVVWWVRAKHVPSILTSALMNDCLERGKPYMDGGARYMQLVGSHPGLPAGGVDAADSLTAIKHLVFDKKSLSMEQVINACRMNFKGTEQVRVRRMLLEAPKYGNDDDEADLMMDRVVRDTGAIVKQQVSPYGRPCGAPAAPGVTWHYFFGHTVSALPNGRKAREPLADGSLSPMQGMDRKGPTAVFNSAAKVNLDARWGVVLNLKFAGRMLAGRDKLERAAALLTTYFNQGGFNVQLNLQNPEDLIAAKQDPWKYRDLIVRVAGYSTYFIELAPEVQDEIISRTLQEV